MPAPIRILPMHGMTGAYDVRRIEGKVLIHLGDVWRDGHEWVARKHGGTISTGHRIRRDAIAELSV